MSVRNVVIRFPLGALLAASMALTACGGSGGGGSPVVDSGPRDVPPAGQNAVAGPVDPVQEVLTQVGAGAAQVPALGPASQSLVDGLVSLLDAVDGLAGGFREFLTTQNPDALLQGGRQAGSAILSFSGGLQEALLELNQTGQQIPGLGSVLAQLETLQQQVRDATFGAAEGGDISAVTNTLRDLVVTLGDLQSVLPAQLKNRDQVSSLLNVVGNAADDLAVVLDETGQLDGTGTGQALVALVEHLANNLAGVFPGDVGTQLTAPLNQFTGTFQQGLAVLLEPLFQTLRGVLAPVTGADAPLNILGGSGDLAGVDRSEVKGPLFKLGDLLAALQGIGGSGGAAALQNALSAGGSIPLVGDLLQTVLAGAGAGGQTPSLPVIGDLLGSLLAGSGSGALPIDDLLSAGGSLGAGGLVDALTGLLDKLLGLAGGLSATDGGFLGNGASAGLLGTVQSLLDTVLGGLLGGLG